MSSRCLVPIPHWLLARLLSLLLLVELAAANTATPVTCTGQAIGQSGCYLTDAAGAVLNSMRTICILNDLAVTGIQGTEVCADVCDINRGSSSYMIARAGADNAFQINLAFSQMVVSVRAGNNANVKCIGAPAWWKAMNHDWCHPGKPCNHMATQAKVDDCSVDSDRGVCRGICVVDPSGPGGRACWDMCNRNLEAKKYGEGARAGVEGEVNTARTDGTCTSTSWGLWFSLIVFFVLVGICIIGAIVWRMRKAKANRSRHQAFDPVLDNAQAMPDMPSMEQMPTSGRSFGSGRTPQEFLPQSQPPHQQFQPKYEDRIPSHSQQPPSYAPNSYFGEPKLQSPSLAPPPQAFSQVPIQGGAYEYSQPAVTSGYTAGPNYSSYSQQGFATAGYGGQPLMVQGPVTASTPSAFQTQQGGFQFYK